MHCFLFQLCNYIHKYIARGEIRAPRKHCKHNNILPGPEVGAGHFLASLSGGSPGCLILPVYLQEAEEGKPLSRTNMGLLCPSLCLPDSNNADDAEEKLLWKKKTEK